MLKAINKLVLYVDSLEKTKDFYLSLGFNYLKGNEKAMTFELNGFELDFVESEPENRPEFQKESKLAPRGAGLFILIEVENVDEFFKKVSNLNPSSEPRDWDWGRREFLLRDLDGYKLVFYQKI